MTKKQQFRQFLEMMVANSKDVHAPLLSQGIKEIKYNTFIAEEGVVQQAIEQPKPSRAQAIAAYKAQQVDTSYPWTFIKGSSDIKHI